jgi:hypothetical protein
VINEPGGVLFRRDLAVRLGLRCHLSLRRGSRLLVSPARPRSGYYVPETLVSFRVSPGAWSVTIGANQAAEFRGLAAEMVNDGRSAPGRLDLAVGRMLALLNNVLRLFLYRFLFAGR